MGEAYLKQIAFSITKHNVAGATTLEADITINGEQQYIVHRSIGKNEPIFNHKDPTKIKLEDGDQLQFLDGGRVSALVVYLPNEDKQKRSMK